MKVAMIASDMRKKERENMYRAFEECYRGSRELIKSRLTVYLPFVLPLKDIFKENKILDLGCGRGEWLELLAENGFDVYGVDLDENMLAACRERLFSVSNEDAITYLQSMPDESHTVISAFHLVEHIPFEHLQCLIQESLRILKPGGILILETPNTENLLVGSVNFYFDPTHQRPLPLQLLSFLTDYFGFARTKVLRLQEDSNLGKMMEVPLLAVLTGVSPDCAVVAQKKANEDYLQLFKEPFVKEYGINLEIMVQKYDNNIFRKFFQLEERVTQAEAKAEQREIELQRIYQSRLWRTLAPLRVIIGIFRTFKNGGSR